MDPKGCLAIARRWVPKLGGVEGPVARSVKCVVVPSELDGRPVVVKLLVSTSVPWGYYMRRERAVLAALPRDLRVHVPRIVAETPEDSNVLVMDRMEGGVLQPQRHQAREHDDETWDALLDVHRAILACRLSVPEPRPTPSERRAMRRRLLEDPTAPREWVAHGLAHADLSASEAKLAVSALDDGASASSKTRAGDATTFAHGDLLLRNVLSSLDGRLSVVDWECAGEYLAGWDGALLWLFAPPRVRKILCKLHPSRAFLALVVLAFTREIHYRRRRPRPDAVTERFVAERGELLSALAR